MTPPKTFNAPDTAALAELRAGVERLAAIARRRWRTFLVVLVLAATAIQGVAFIWPGTYEAQAAVLLQKTRLTSGVDSDRTQPTTVVTGTVSEEEVNSEIAVLTSRRVLEATAKAAGLGRLQAPWYIRLLFSPLRGYERAYAWMHDAPYPTQEQRALDGLAKSIGVHRLKESNILVVTFRAGDPAFAEIVLNELLKQYLDWHVAVHSRVDVQPFFTNQAGVLSSEVVELQNQLQSLNARLGIADMEIEREIAMRQDASLREEALQLRRQVAELDAKLREVSGMLTEDEDWTRVSTTTRPSTQGLDALRSQILQLELEEIQITARYKDDTPLVRENRARLAAARAAYDAERRNVAEESTVGLNPRRTVLQQESGRIRADRAGAAQRLRLIEQQMADSRERLGLLDRTAAEAARLDLQLRSAKERYLMYLDRSEKARVDAALDQGGIANASIVQHAAAPLKPVSPKRLITLILSLLGGLTIALLVCAWLELAQIGLVGALAAMAPRSEATT